MNATSGQEVEQREERTDHKPKYTTVSEALEKADNNLKDLFESLKAYFLALGDDVQMKELLYYYAFKALRNIATVEVKVQKNCLVVYVNVNPDEVQLEKGFTRDVRNVGHLGTGILEITIKSREDLEKAKPLLERSYEIS